MKTLSKTLLASALLYSLGCATPQRDQFKINMVTESDDGYSLAGVSVYHGETLLGKSTTSGSMDVIVEAAVGSQFELRFDCPEGYSATRDNVLVPLRAATEVTTPEPKPEGQRAEGEPKPEGDAPASKEAPTEASPSVQSDYSVTLECRPAKRQAMVVVRSNMANVPVKIGKKTMGVTNAAGIAHIDLSMAPKEVFEVWLDSSTNEFLRPVNPQFPFVMPDHDELFVLQEAFKIEEPVVVAVAKRKKRKKRKKKEKIEKPTRPTQIGAGTQWGSVKDKKDSGK